MDKDDFSKIKDALNNQGKSRPNKAATSSSSRNLNKQREAESNSATSYHEISHLRNQQSEKLKNPGRLIKDQNPEESRQIIKPKLPQQQKPPLIKSKAPVQNRCSSPIFRNDKYFKNNDGVPPPSFIKLPQSMDDESDAIYVPTYAFDRKTNSLIPIHQLITARSDNSNCLTERNNKEIFKRSQQPQFPPISNRESSLPKSIDSSRIIISNTGVPTIELAEEDYSVMPNSGLYRYNLKKGAPVTSTHGSYRLKAEQRHPWDIDPQFPQCPYPIRQSGDSHQQNVRYSKAESYKEAGYKIDDLLHAREALKLDDEYLDETIIDESYEALPRICDIPKYSDEYAEATKPKKSTTSNSTQSQVTFLDESVATADVLMVDDESRSPFTNPAEQYKEPNLHLTERESDMKKQSKSCSVM